MPYSLSLFVHFISLHSFTHTATPTPRKSCHSFAHFVPFRYFHFRGLCLFQRYYQCACSIVPFHSTKLHHRTHTPLIVLFATIHYIHSFLPALAFPNANVRAKKCAKLAAGSTQPPRSALPVSGAFAPLAAARTQRTGLILRSVSLLSHLSLAINAGSRLFLPYLNIGLNLLRPHQPPTTHPKYLGQLFFFALSGRYKYKSYYNTPFGQFKCSFKILNINTIT